MPQDVRKIDNKARTFAPKESEIYQTIKNVDGLPEYDEESDRSKKKLKIIYGYYRRKRIYFWFNKKT